MENEIWKVVPGYTDYMVSDYGRVKSMWYGKERTLTHISSHGYLQVNLHKDGKGHTFHIGVLVAMAFLDFVPCGHTLVVDHIDGDKQHDHWSNLRIVTTRKNATMCYRKDRNIMSSKYPGVCWHKNIKKWQSEIRINGKGHYIGVFNTELEAYNAYQTALSNLKPDPER